MLSPLLPPPSPPPGAHIDAVYTGSGRIGAKTFAAVLWCEINVPILFVSLKIIFNVC